ncbi:ATP-binding cassette domain-containing protein [Streptococcus halotolerans]|uniref:ATP-binding cassette domain-containing protein n=1 Tax=Streptococcus halotolerans TaxID=1814128 RepID=UPI0007881E9A|nr:ATP-binding cassette domain-containing protein [Streptococcus halotolerans]
MFNICELSQSFKSDNILNGITCTFPDSEISIIVGTNGCGKTTFLNVLAQMIPYSTGEIICNGYKIGSKEYKEQIFYIPSDFYLPEYMTGIEYLTFILKHYKNANYNQIDILLEIFDLKEFKDVLLEKYSFGMKKKIQIIAAFCSGTPYILADEVFSGLDFDTALLLEELLNFQKRYRSFVIVSHDMNTLNRFSNNIYIMSKGCLLPYKGLSQDIKNIIKQIGQTGEKFDKLQKYMGDFNTFY